MKCKNCESTDLVYSGVDAFIYGVPTETYCYTCATHIYYLNQTNEAPMEVAN